MSRKINIMTTAESWNYSKLSHSLQVTLNLNSEAIRMIEDIMGDTSSDMEAISDHIASMLHRIIMLDYSHGGMRRTYRND